MHPIIMGVFGMAVKPYKSLVGSKISPIWTIWYAYQW